MKVFVVVVVVVVWVGTFSSGLETKDNGRLICAHAQTQTQT